MRSSLIPAGLLAVTGRAFAQTPTPGMAADGQEMMAAMDTMNPAMAAPAMTGDPDRDFVAMMTPHQGAIDMARLYLRQGRDPAIREFQAWPAKHPAPSR